MASELKEPNADLLVNQKLLPFYLKNRHFIVDYLILKEIVQLGLTNKEIFRILFPDFPHNTKIAGIKISPKIQRQLKYFANVPMLELEKHPFLNDSVKNIWKSILIEPDPFGLGGRCRHDAEIHINNKVTKITKFDIHDGAIVAVGDDGQRGIMWKSEFFDVANSFEKIKEELEDIDIIAFTDHAFAILNNQGKLHVFGDEKYGGTLPEELKDKDIHDIESTHGAFAARLKNQDVIVWGLESAGGAPPEEVKRKLKRVVSISSTHSAFLATTFDGEGIVWGHEQYGGNPSDEIKNQLKNNKGHAATLGAFILITSDGNFISWGHGYYGADPSEEIKQKLKEVGDNLRGLYNNYGAFAVTLENGDDPITWGTDDDPKFWRKEIYEGEPFLRPKKIQLEPIHY
jgi:hypothetical protein